MEIVQFTASREERYHDGRLEVDFRRSSVVVDGRPLHLTVMEYRLLVMLVANVGDIVPRATLLREVWGYGAEVRTRTLDVHIRRLRGKLGDYSRQHIETIFGVGYRLQPPREPARLQVSA